MKMPTIPKMKMPKLPKLPKPQPKRLQATARRAAQPAIDDYDEEPTTRLSSAFVVVLILHVVAVGGIYAFNSIKAHRRGNDVVAAQPAAAPVKDSAPSPDNTVAATAPVEQPAAPATVSQSPASVAPAAVASVTPSAQPPAVPVSPISGNRIHRVRSGDTLTRVASLYNVSISDLEAANGLKPGAILRPAQALNIPDSKPESTKTAAVEARKTEPTPARKTESVAKAATPAKDADSAHSSPKTYKVKKGENPVAIARQLGVSYSELLKLNKISDPKKLQIGQVLKVPAKKRD